MRENRTPIKYTGRDFEGIRESLIGYAKKYYPNTYKDLSEAGFGSLMVDMVSYVGDIMSYYLDYQTNESFLDTSIEYDNIVRMGKSVGYKNVASFSSFGEVTFFIEVPGSGVDSGPDYDYVPTLARGSVFRGGASEFLLVEAVNFGHPDNEVVVSTVSGGETRYIISAVGEVMSGRYEREVVSVGSHSDFLRIELSSEDVTEVVSVIDSEGNEYFEVENLTQDVVYRSVSNRDTETRNDATDVLKPMLVPRRFVVEREEDRVYLQFGHGSESRESSPSVIDPKNIVTQIQGKEYITEEYFDPSKLLETDKMGISPSDTELEIELRVNTTSNVNLSAGQLDEVVFARYEYEDVDSLIGGVRNRVESSLELSNLDPIIGDVSSFSKEELRHRVMSSFTSQGRAVTRQDYISMCYSMPSRYGSIKAVNVSQDLDSLKRNINLYVVSEDGEGELVQANGAIKQNLKTWLNRVRMLNDTIDILDARIVNLRIEFKVMTDLDRNKYDVLADSTRVLARLAGQRYMSMGESFSLGELYEGVNNVPGVVDVVSIDVYSEGGVYFDVESNLSEGGKVIYCPEDVIFELKNPSSNIRGVVI